MGIFSGLARAFTGESPRIDPDEHVLIEDGFAPGLVVSTPTYRVYAVKMDAEGDEIPPRRYLERQPLEDGGHAEAYRTWVENCGAAPRPPFPVGSV